jgi:hypothetical protein
MERCALSCSHIVNVGAIWYDEIHDVTMTMTMVMVRCLNKTGFDFLF